MSENRRYVANAAYVHLHRVEVCATSGLVAGDACPTRVTEWVPAGPAETCAWHHASDESLITVWPDIYRAWARQNGVLRDGTATARIAESTRASGPSARTQPAGLAAGPALTIERRLAERFS